MPPPLPRFTAAAVQATPAFLNLEGCLEKAHTLTLEAARNGARLVVFPETWLPGYPVWTNAVSRWNYTPSKRTYARLVQNSVEVPGPAVDALGQMAREAGVYLIIGVHERIPSGTLYNSLLFFAPNGHLLGVHRKLVPTYHERMVWAYGDGSTVQVFDTSLGRLGGLICWEHWMPLARYALYAQGLQVSASVWPTATETFLLAARHMAHEGRCFLVVSASVMSKAHLPSDFDLAKEMEPLPDALMRGGSAIIAPDGKFLAGPVYDQEIILYAEVDLQRCLEEKSTLDVVGHYARPEVFRLLVDRTPKVPCSFTGETLGEALARLERLAQEGQWVQVREGLTALRRQVTGGYAPAS